MTEAEDFSTLKDRALINAARTGLAVTVNPAMTKRHWRPGRRTHAGVLQGARAGYGAQIVTLLAQQLEADQGRGSGVQSPRRLQRFGEVFDAKETVYALSRHVSWTHVRSLIYSKSCTRLSPCRNRDWRIAASPLPHIGATTTSADEAQTTTWSRPALHLSLPIPCQRIGRTRTSQYGQSGPPPFKSRRHRHAKGPSIEAGVTRTSVAFMEAP